MNKIKKLVNQTAIYGLSTIIGRLLNYLLVPLYTRYFIPEEYGVVTELYAYMAFLLVFLTYGMETAFFRFSKKDKNTNKVYSTALISITSTALIFILLVFANTEEISHSIGLYDYKIYIKWISIIVALDAISSISFAKLRQENKALKFSLIRLTGIFLNIFLNIIFIVYYNLGIEYIFIANLIASSVILALLFLEIVKSSFEFDITLWKKMMVYALPLLVAGLAGMINETIDRILLKQFLHDSETALHEIGIYGAFYKLSIIMTLFIQTFRYAAEPFFFSQEKEKNNTKIYADVMKYFVIVTAIIFLTVIIFYDIIKGFIGSNYHDERGFLVVSVLLLANMFLGIYYNLSIWYKLTEKTKYGAIFSIFGALITLALNIALIPLIGFEGSAWATLVCYFSMCLMSYFTGRKHYPIPYNIRRISFYMFVMFSFYFSMIYYNFSMFINSIYLIFFIILVVVLEKRKTNLVVK